jgi:hypothetical protein
MPKTALPSARARLILPEKAGFLYKRLYAYLNQTRGIDSSIITALIHERKIYEDQRGNVVFVGYDENNVARFASLRGTYTDKPFRMDCAGSDKRYSFNMMATMPSERLYVFESPIDAMSHASIETVVTGGKGAWNCYSRLSLAGTSDAALSFFLRRYNSIKELIFCLDNDAAGQEASINMARSYGEKGYITRIEPPKGKDCNDDLLQLKKEGLIIDERKKHRNRDCH